MFSNQISSIVSFWSRHNKLLNSLLKVAIFVLLLAALYWQLFHKRDLQSLLSTFQDHLDKGGMLKLVLALLLIPANWLLESEKWRRLIAVVEQIKPAVAIEAVITAVTVGLFTPNRVGEFGGRLLYLKKENRWPAVLISLVGSLAQIAATLLAGLLAAWWFYRLNEGQWNFPWLTPVLLLSFALSLLAYFNLQKLLATLFRWSFLKKLKQQESLFKTLNRSHLSMALGFSLARYGVFTAQYLFLLSMYGIDLQAGAALSALGLIFLAQIVLPTFALFEAVKRGSIAVFFLGFFVENEIGIIAASTTLWIINVILPALFGYVFIARRDLAAGLKTRTN